LADSPEKIQKFLTEQPDIKALFKEPTFAELKVVLARYLDPDSDVGEPTPVASKSEPVSATTARSTEAKTSTSVKDMIDEFDEVFN
jgi:hypothetical protein